MNILPWRICLVLAAAKILTLGLLSSGMAQSISVSPSRIFFTGNAGETVTKTITFQNTSAQPISFVARTDDWDRDTLGKKRFFAQGTVKHSNGGWLGLSAASVTVPPGQTKSINVTMAVPAQVSTTAQSHSMLFFKQVKDQASTAKGSIGLTILLEVGVQIYYTPPGLSRGELEVVAFSDKGYKKQGKDSVKTLALKVENTGYINKDATVRVELTNKKTGEETKLEDIPIALLPQSWQWVGISLPYVTPGQYLVVAIVDAGPSYNLKVAEKNISIGN